MNPTRPHLFGLLAGLFLAAGIAFASLVFANTWSHISESQVVAVTGSAHRNVRSDLVLWRANFFVEAPTLLEAQQKLHADYGKVLTFLQLHNCTDFTVSSPQIQELTAKQRNDEDNTVVNVLVGYRLTQTVEVRSGEVDRVPRLVGNTGELLEQGVAFMSEGIEYIYTKVADAKVEMMAEATRDARVRAEQIASQGSRRVKELRSAHVGVVQINPIYSAATSWQGNNDTTSLEKTITATVNAVFLLD